MRGPLSSGLAAAAAASLLASTFFLGSALFSCGFDFLSGFPFCGSFCHTPKRNCQLSRCLIAVFYQHFDSIDESNGRLNREAYSVGRGASYREKHPIKQS
jgi:hypothetical protein